MGNAGIKNIIIGVILMLVGYLLKPTFAEWDLPFLLIVVEVIGLLVAGLGVRAYMQDKGKSDEDRAAEQKALCNEVLLKVLSRMTYADSNTKSIEIKAVQKILKRHTGTEISEADIRVSARGDLHDSKGIGRYLSGCRDKLSIEDRTNIIKAMGEVVKSDGSVSPGEVSFFDEVGKAFKLNPSEIVDLK